MTIRHRHTIPGRAFVWASILALISWALIALAVMAVVHHA